jgi:hypothetical protein
MGWEAGRQIYTNLSQCGKVNTDLSLSEKVKTDLNQCGRVKNATTNRWFLSLFDRKIT